MLNEVVAVHADSTLRIHVLFAAAAAAAAAGGGDGTLNEVVAAMMAHRDAMHRLGMAVALLPLGTANDFACTAGISVVSKAVVAVEFRCCSCCHCWCVRALLMTLRAQQASQR
jgi:diacylglycerol kinase family enzyme